MEFCNDNNCMDCCKDAVVPLLNEDINKIVMHGYYDVYFTEVRDGIKILRTRPDGSCIFYKKDTGSCEIYRTMPERCKLNPYCICGQNHEPCIDTACKYSQNCKEDRQMYEKMHEYIAKLQKEIDWRRKHSGHF